MYQTMCIEDQSMNIESEMLTIEAMLQQEESGYTVQDFLRNLPASTALGQPVDADARYAIASWCVKIMEACRYKRDTATIAMSYLDRFMSSSEGRKILLDRREYQLAALAAVYSAVKIHEQQAIAPHLVAKLSNGEHTGSEIEQMEFRLLQALQWRVNPPTAMTFARQYLDLVSKDPLDEKSKQVLLDLAQYQIDASLIHYEFCTKNASNVGLAALLNAVESVPEGGLPLSCFDSMVARQAASEHIPLYKLRDRLYEAISTEKSISKASTLPVLRRPTCDSRSISKTGETCYSVSPRSVQLA